MQEPLIWIDLEMTGLDPERHVILEIASLLTDESLNIISEGPCIAIHPQADALASMDEWSREQHHRSGLLGRAQNSPYDHQAAERFTLGFLFLHSRKGLSPLCGNSIWQDRRFLIKHMPELEAFFHYRNIDVSSVKELVRRWYPALPPFQKQKTHTALSDIKESIAELRYYREKVFV
jgi:oligoribonuclease